MARFMERFERHLADDPELRAEYERLAPRFRAISASIAARREGSSDRTGKRGRYSGSQ